MLYYVVFYDRTIEKIIIEIIYFIIVNKKNKMKITWSNIHYIVFTVIILNFIMVYYLKESNDDSSPLDTATVQNEPIIVLKENAVNETKPTRNSSLADSNIAEDIGKAVSESGNTIPVIDSGVKQFLEVIGTEDKILAPASVIKEEYNSISTIVIMLLLLIAIALGVTFIEKKSMDERMKGCSKKSDISDNIRSEQYYMLNDD